MVDPHFSEDEQLEKLKDWWKRNGTAVVGGAALGIGVVVAVTSWRYYVEQRAEAASALYEQMLIQRAQQKWEQASSAGTQLRDGYASTAYAGKAALIMARIKFDQGDHSGAMGELRWAMENATEPATQHAARLRLAYLLMDQGELEAARQYLEPGDQGGFESEYNELAGDLHVAIGQPAQAQAFYQRALDTLPAGSKHEAILRMKLDDVAMRRN